MLVVMKTEPRLLNRAEMRYSTAGRRPVHGTEGAGSAEDNFSAEQTPVAAARVGGSEPMLPEGEFMTSRRFGVTAIAVALSLGMQLSCASAETVTKAEREGILSLHNAYRDHHCVPALTWSAELAAAAQKWADKCWIGHDKTRGHIGENLAWGGDRSAGSAVDAWYI